MNRENRIWISVIAVITGLLFMVSAWEKPDPILIENPLPERAMTQYTITYQQDGRDYRIVIPRNHPPIVDINGYAYKLVRDEVGERLAADYKDRVEIQINEPEYYDEELATAITY